jgi:hypothetical protein
MKYRVICLRCHKKKGKRCTEESIYYQLVVRTHVGRTPLSCSNTLTLNMTATVDAAHFIPHGQVVPRGVQYFRNDLCKGCGDLSEVSFILWSFSVHK